MKVGIRKSFFWVVLLGVLAVGLVTGSDLWAAPGQNPGRQTVPTRTPVPPPPTEPPPPPPTETPSPPSSHSSKPSSGDQPSPTSVPTSTSTAQPAPSEPLLPAAGGRSARLYLSAATVILGLFALVVVRRYV